MGYRDAEGAVAEFFRPQVPAGRVVSEVPRDLPDVLVVCRRTGGAAVNRKLDSPIITVTVWALTRTDAAALAGQLRDYLYNSWGRRLEEVAGLYFDPDPATERPRYTFSAQLWMPSRY